MTSTRPAAAARPRIRGHAPSTQSNASRTCAETVLRERRLARGRRRALGEIGRSGAIEQLPESVRADDDFFLLGGDSLRAAQLLAQVRDAFEVDMSIEALFHDAATVARMARIIERARPQRPHELKPMQQG